MTTELDTTAQDNQEKEVKIQTGSSETIYGLGLIGAWVYYFRRATNFREGLIGFFKGIVWPAILVAEALEFLNKE